MWKFKRIDFAEILSDQKYIAFTGSGGKTSLTELLAREFLKMGRTVAITTTTKIFAKEPYIVFNEGFSARKRENFIRVGRDIEKGKLTALGFEDVKMLGEIYDVVLIEADGAKGMSVKFPASYEPVIPSFCEKIIVICGLDGFNRRVDEAVFRWQLFCKAAGIAPDSLIDWNIFIRLFAPDALLKDVDVGKCMVVLNKYDISNIRKELIKRAKELIENTGIMELIISSALFNMFYGIEILDL